MGYRVVMLLSCKAKYALLRIVVPYLIRFDGVKRMTLFPYIAKYALLRIVVPYWTCGDEGKE